MSQKIKIYGKRCICILNTLYIIPIIISLCRYYPRNIDVDYMGIIFGGLSILVTVLITLQIFYVIKIQDIKEEMEDSKMQNLNNIFYSQYLVYKSMSEYYYSYINKDNLDISDWFYNYISQGLDAILCAIHSKHFDSANNIINTLGLTISNEHIYIKKETKRELFDKISKIKEVQQNINVDKLNALISTIECNNDDLL